MGMSKTIKVDAKQYEDCDDCLQAAADAAAQEYGCEGYDLNPRWLDDEREIILVDVPDWAESGRASEELDR